MDDFKRVSIASDDESGGVGSSDVAVLGVAPSGDIQSSGPSSGKRASARSAMVLSARLRLDGEDSERDVRVRNLSEGGLMLELDRLVAVGTAIALDLPGVGAIGGTVAWCTQGRVGVALDSPIDPSKARAPGS